jgi:hypothetical protein
MIKMMKKMVRRHLPLKETVLFYTVSAISRVTGKRFAMKSHKFILT